MIRQVTLRRFKRFAEVTFEFPGHVVLAGPNNTGKTTVLQAIAAWSLALQRWKELNDFSKHRGGYAKAPIARQAFSAVALRAFDLLWLDRRYQGSVEVEIASDQGWAVAMELIKDTTEQIYVRPTSAASPQLLRELTLAAVFVPAMSGLSTEEPVFRRPKLDQLLGQAKSGEVLRNLLVEAAASDDAWSALAQTIRELFGYHLHPPDGSGPHILAEYSTRDGGPRLDIASSGSGFQQVLMLLAFLHTRPGTVLLIDEPDAHLHVILQDAIYGELRRVAATKDSQLVVATHSEVIINAVAPEELCVLLHRPRMLADGVDRRRLTTALRVLSNEDLMRALEAPGVLYLEDWTDLEILRAWARLLEHPALELLTTRLFWRKVVFETRRGAAGVKWREHYDALRLARDDLPGLVLLDGDDHPDIKPTRITGRGLQRLRWRRYEIESYLVHPRALERFVEQTVGQAAAGPNLEDLRAHLVSEFNAGFVEDPARTHRLVESYLEVTKARTMVLPGILDAAGLPAFPYTRYSEIAAVMLPEEIHPDVIEVLDVLVRAFRQ